MIIKKLTFLILSLCLLVVVGRAGFAVQAAEDGGSIITEGVVGFKKKTTDSSQTKPTDSTDDGSSSDQTTTPLPVADSSDHRLGGQSEKPPGGSLLKAGEKQQVLWIFVGIFLVLLCIFLYRKRRRQNE